MDPVLFLLFTAVGAGASPKTQRLTLTMADRALQSDDAGVVEETRSNLCGMVASPRLSREALSALRQHPDVKVRTHTWRYGPATDAELIAHARTERTALVRAGMIKRQRLTADVAEQLVRPLNFTIAQAIATANVSVHPDTALESLRFVGTTNRFPGLKETARKAVLTKLAWVPATEGNLLAMLTDADTHPLAALALLRNVHLGEGVRAAHLPGVLTALETHLGSLANLGGPRARFLGDSALARQQLAFLAKLDLTEGELADIEPVLRRDTRLLDYDAWKKLLDPAAWRAEQQEAARRRRLDTGEDTDAPAALSLQARVEGADSSAALTALWATAAPQQQLDLAEDFVQHALCDLALFRTVWEEASLGKRSHVGANVEDFAAAQLWTVTDEEMFRSLAAVDPYGSLSRAVSDDLPVGAAPTAVLLGWFLDEIVNPAGEEYLHSHCATDANLWRPLVNHPQFPRERFDQIPTEVLAALVDHRGTDSWVLDTVMAKLEELPDADADTTLALLDSLATVPFGGAVGAVSGAFSA